MYQKIIKDLQNLKNPAKAKILQGFFKTGKGEYGEGDVFLGIVVPLQRQLAKKYFKEAGLNDVQKLLNSKVHEQRMVGVLMLVEKFKTPSCHAEFISASPYAKTNKNYEIPKQVLDDIRKKIFDLYLKNTKHINNWDLVDLSAPNIVGPYLLEKPKKILYKLVKSKNIWERRVAILATFTFIRNNQFDDALKISEILLNDKHDLIHKAVGWMIREIGKRDLKTLENFLNKYYRKMPRTMLRYAIEKLPESKRKFYMK